MKSKIRAKKLAHFGLTVIGNELASSKLLHRHGAVVLREAGWIATDLFTETDETKWFDAARTQHRRAGEARRRPIPRYLGYV